MTVLPDRPGASAATADTAEGDRIRAVYARRTGRTRHGLVGLFRSHYLAVIAPAGASQ